MSKYILATRPFREEFIQQMREIAPDYQFITSDELEEEFDWSQVEITIGWSKKWEEKLLTPTTSLKWVQSISAGVDTLPLKAFAKYAIRLSNARGIHAHSITDHLLAILFMKSRGIFEAVQNQQAAVWEQDVQINNLQDWRILVVGTGKIGQYLAKSLDFFQCEIVGINTNGRKIAYFNETYPLIALAPQAQKADIVINTLPLTEDTYHLYNENFFDVMKRSAMFINVGRGASVDTEALYQALDQKKIGFAALDVFEEEPLPKDHPFWELKNILITPHLSGYTPHFQKAFMKIFLDNLISFVDKGTLVKNIVNMKTGY